MYKLNYPVFKASFIYSNKATENICELKIYVINT